MALIFCDGFDHYDTAHIEQKWDATVGEIWNPIVISVGTGRFSTNAIRLTDGWNYVMKAIPSGPQAVVSAGVSINPTDGIVNAPFFPIAFKTDTRFLCGVGISPTHQLYAWSGHDGTYTTHNVLGYATNPIRSKTHQYIEVHVGAFHSTTGSIKVYLNGALEIDLSGVETNSFSVTSVNDTTADAVTIGGKSSYVRTDFNGPVDADDFYLTDGTGLYNTDVLGDVRIEELLPNADGFYQQWDPLGAGLHYVEVDDPYNAIDDDTTYVSTNVVNEIDTYTFPSVTPTAGDVKGVAVNFYAKKTDSGTRRIQMLARLPAGAGGTDGTGTEVSLGGVYAVYQSYMERDPNGNQWTIANILASEAGIKLSY